MVYVQDVEALRGAAQVLARTELVGLDTEAAGYHRYHDRVCLIQLSNRARTFLVDALAVTTLQPLAQVLGDERIEVVLHDADYDLRLLARDYGITVSRLFDTRIAAQFVGAPGLGLGALVEQYLGIRLAKKFQKADWAQRPLPAEMLEYAAEDTRHLPALRDRLKDELTAAGRLAWAEEEFRLREGTRWAQASAADEPYLRLRGAHDLSPRELAVLRELYAWREEQAAERDVATFRVMSNEALLDLTRLQPRTTAELAGMRGVSAGLVERRGRELIAAVRRGLELPDAELPRRQRAPRRPPPAPEFDAAVERLRAARDRAAERLGLDRGFLMPRSQLEAIARAEPGSATELLAVDEMRRWQVEAMGDDLMAALRGVGSGA
jgi:ribonuclease D